MKKTITIFLLAFTFLFTGMTMEARTFKYIGKIGPYDVSVTLKETYNEYSNAMGTTVTGIEGSYTYTKAGNSLRLEGECGGGMLGGTSLEEYTPKGKHSGNWDLEGYYVGDKIMKGTFTNLSNGKKFTINLKLKR